MRLVLHQLFSHSADFRKKGELSPSSGEITSGAKVADSVQGNQAEQEEEEEGKITRTEQLAIEKPAARSGVIAETLESIDAFEASIHTRATLPTARPLSTGSIPQDKNHTSPLRMVRYNTTLEVALH